MVLNVYHTLHIILNVYHKMCDPIGFMNSYEEALTESIKIIGNRHKVCVAFHIRENKEPKTFVLEDGEEYTPLYQDRGCLTVHTVVDEFGSMKHYRDRSELVDVEKKTMKDSNQTYYQEVWEVKEECPVYDADIIPSDHYE